MLSGPAGFSGGDDDDDDSADDEDALDDPDAAAAAAVVEGRRAAPSPAGVAAAQARLVAARAAARSARVIGLCPTASDQLRGGGGFLGVLLAALGRGRVGAGACWFVVCAWGGEGAVGVRGRVISRGIPLTALPVRELQARGRGYYFYKPTEITMAINSRVFPSANYSTIKVLASRAIINRYTV